MKPETLDQWNARRVNDSIDAEILGAKLFLIACAGVAVFEFVSLLIALWLPS